MNCRAHAKIISRRSHDGPSGDDGGKSTLMAMLQDQSEDWRSKSRTCILAEKVRKTFSVDEH